MIKFCSNSAVNTSNRSFNSFNGNTDQKWVNITTTREEYANSLLFLIYILITTETKNIE